MLQSPEELETEKEVAREEIMRRVLAREEELNGLERQSPSAIPLPLEATRSTSPIARDLGPYPSPEVKIVSPGISIVSPSPGSQDDAESLMCSWCGGWQTLPMGTDAISVLREGAVLDGHARWTCSMPPVSTPCRNSQGELEFPPRGP